MSELKKISVHKDIKKAHQRVENGLNLGKVVLSL